MPARLPVVDRRAPHALSERGPSDARAATVPETDAILGQGRDVSRVVRHEDERDRRLIPQPLQVRRQRTASLGVQTREGFVEEKDPRVHAEGAGDGDAARFAAGEGLRPAMTEASQIHQIERRLDRNRPRRVTRPEGEIVGDGQVRKQSRILEDEADPAAMGRRRAAGVRINDDVVVDLESNRGRGRKAGEGEQEGGLARPGRAFHSERARLAPSAEVEDEGVAAGADVKCDQSAGRPF